MVQLIRPVDKNIEKLFVPDIETLFHITDNLIIIYKIFFMIVNRMLSAVASLMSPPIV